ncbi:MAG: A/G-specific adenine glycosylase [Anaerolineae bacterium]
MTKNSNLSDAQAGELPAAAYGAISFALLAWYAIHRRDLPWRRTQDPYRIWVSEIMLQQTQVATVIPYYERFLAHFPTLAVLASADLGEVLSVWEGLGYYGRARNLHAAARVVQSVHGGRLPCIRKELLSLPGVGAYTAGALLSIACGQDEPALDANGLRILARLFDVPQDIASSAGKRSLYAHALRLLPAGRAGAWNQALMDHGALVCLPRAPRCAVCPLASWCLARARGVQGQRPVKAPRGEVPHQTWVAGLCERKGRVLLVRRRPNGLLGGLWELPGGALQPDEDDATALVRILGSDLGVSVLPGEAVTKVAHGFTHLKVTVQVLACRLVGEPFARGIWDTLHWWAPEERGDYALTGITARVLDPLYGPGVAGKGS